MQVLSTDQLVGQILGNYCIERFLGKGRLNAVYLGRNLVSQRLDALTMYLVPSHFSVAAKARFLKRFRKESAAITKLDHPHILSVYEYGEYEGTPYLVTPYVDQGSLADQLKSSGRYDHTEIVPVLEQLASGVAYAHRQGYIHGTLRLSNVVVRDENTLQVAGFGLMHMLQLGGIEKSEQPYAHLLTVGQTFLASPEYVAPEVVEGQGVDVRSDIYALGCILFELLCGRPPFIGSDPFEVARQHVSQDIPSLRTLCPEVPIALVSVVNQALERDPVRRFQYVEELTEAFIQVSRGASPQSVQRGRYLEEEQDWSEKTRISERLAAVSPDGYRDRNTGKWQLLPPIITGKLPALQLPSAPVGTSSIVTMDQPLYQGQSAAVTLPPVSAISDSPRLAPEVDGAYSASVQLSYPTDVQEGLPLPSVDQTLSAPPQPIRSAKREEKGINSFPTPGNTKAVPAFPDPAVNSIPGVYEDKNKLVQSYAWWSQPGTAEEDQEGSKKGAKEGDKPLPSSEGPVRNAQPAQIPPTREPLLVRSSGGWMSEPVAPLDVKRDFGSSTKKSRKGRKVSRRSVVAFLALGGVVAAAGTAGALNLNYLQRFVGLTNQTPVAPPNKQANNAPPANTQTTQPKTPPNANTNTPPNPNTQKKTGPVIENTKQMPNSAVEFTNPASGTPGLLVRLANGTFMAYDRACTHAGVLVNYDPATQKFVCPAHGAIFDPATGAVVKGPAKLPLTKTTVQVQADGTVTTV